jgi:hypothetical protein
MEAKKGRTLDAGRRAQGFLISEAAAIGSAVSPTLRAKLDEAVATLEKFELQQGSSDRTAQGATTAQQRMRQDVYDAFIGPIASIAKVALAGVAEFQNLSAAALIKRKAPFVTRATEVAIAAEKYQAVMVEHGMAPDFVAQFRAALVEVASSRASRDTLVHKRAQATTGIATADKAVRDAIQLVDRQLKTAFKKDPAMAAAWKTAKKIVRLPVTPLPTGSAPDAPSESDAITPAPESALALVPSAQSQAA